MTPAVTPRRPNPLYLPGSAMPPTGDIEFRVDDAIATLTLNRAAKRNALTLDMLDQIDAALACVERDPRIGVLLVESASEQCFCSGADIKEWGDLDPQRMGSRWIRSGNRVFRRLAELDIPSIAVLAGDALGGGLELALACDLRYASRDARLGFPEAAVGAIPGWLGCRRLAGLVGPARSRQLVLTGEAISAERAESWGILNEVLPAGQLSSRVSEVCSVLLSRSSTSLSVGKRLLRLVESDDADIAHEFAASVCKASPDAAEGVRAFREKRQARFERPA
ncbi:enoyl-CoA hydratase/isomerase family protein [Burkholderia gladioli]|uniref:enoyl-CoA hydratase/isomerase family protein n=1 Tax=Burkholderia gladioli TaxID=28095 RepID=UPI001F49714C|nr:enoyl-CoA hydratase/isomerase family protein [Burkholderia gladioli]